MQEIQDSQKLAAQIRDRATKLVELVTAEYDWTEIAELFETIRDLSEHGASRAWLVSYEMDAVYLESQTEGEVIGQ